mgnify:FL=1
MDTGTKATWEEQQGDVAYRSGDKVTWQNTRVDITIFVFLCFAASDPLFCFVLLLLLSN